jgi:hypothetical protein
MGAATALAAGVSSTAWAHWYIDSQGLADDPAPPELRVWIGPAGLAVAVLALGWRSASRRWRHAHSVVLRTPAEIEVGDYSMRFPGADEIVDSSAHLLQVTSMPGRLPRCRTSIPLGPHIKRSAVGISPL